MSTKLIVTNYKNFKCGVKLNEGELVNIRFQPNEDVQIGDIYKVKITEILPNDSGAFVTYGNGDQRGFFKRINFSLCFHFRRLVHKPYLKSTQRSSDL